jgi:hypothetical protein
VAGDENLAVRSGFGLFYASLENDNDLNNYTPVTGTSFTGTTPFVGTLDGITPFNVISNPFPTGLNSLEFRGEAFSLMNTTLLAAGNQHVPACNLGRSRRLRWHSFRGCCSLRSK